MDPSQTAPSSASPETGFPEMHSSSSSSALNTMGNSIHGGIGGDPEDDGDDGDPKSRSIKRKRKRLTISCLTCRKRKIKCDRQKPCSSCIKNNVPAHLCIYDESPWVSTLIKDNKMTDELMNLKQENGHLTDLLKMNEAELNNLKSLLLNLKIGQGKDIDRKEQSPEFAPDEQSEEEVKERFLADQPINIGAFSCFKQTKFAVKVFGPSSWQNFVIGDIRTSYMLDTNIPYIMDLIAKNARRINQAKMVKLRMLNDTKVNDTELEEIEAYLGEYDEVSSNLEYINSVHNQAHFLKYLDDVQVMRNFHTLIQRDPATGRCRILLDLSASDAHVDVANLASLLLILKMSIILQDDTFEVDKDERLVSYAARLFSSMMIMEQPTLPAVMALTLFQSYQLYNPLDFGAECIPHGTSRDYSMLLMIAINSALKLGLHTKMATNYRKDHFNYISPYHLREFWRSLLVMDFITSFQSGLPMAMTGYSDLLERTDESIILKISSETDVKFEDYIKHRKIVSLRSSALSFSTTNQNSSKMSSKSVLIQDCYILKKMVMETRRSDRKIMSILDPYSPELVEDLVAKVVSLDVVISSSYTLFLSFAEPDHVLNSNVDKNCFQRPYNQQNFLLLKRYFNETLLYAVYALRFGAWYFNRVYSDPYWSKNLVLQFVTSKSIKQLMMKSYSLLLILLVKNSKMAGEKVLQYHSRFNQSRGQFFDIFKSSFDELETMVWEKDKYETFNFESDSILRDSVYLNDKLFKTISSQRSFLTVDRKWFISMELCYVSIAFCFSNCSVVKSKFNYKDCYNNSDLEMFKRYYNMDDLYAFRGANYQKNKNEIMKVTSLLN